MRLPPNIGKTLCRDMKILDVGCVGQSKRLFIRYIEILKFKPSYLLGIDINDKEIAGGQELGYNVIRSNIESPEDIKKLRCKEGLFDLVMLMDVIEHLDNIGSALSNINSLLKIGGKVYVTTPNPFSSVWLEQIRDNGVCVINKDHVHWFDKQTLSYLGGRYGFNTEVLTEDLQSELKLVLIKEREISEKSYCYRS